MSRVAQTLAGRNDRRGTFGIVPSLDEEDAEPEGTFDSGVPQVPPTVEERSQRRRPRQRHRSEVQDVEDGIDKERILERLSRRPSVREKPWGYL